MSPTLLKIYGFFIVATLLFSNILLTKRGNQTTTIIPDTSSVFTKTNGDDSGVILPPTVPLTIISTTSKNEISRLEKINKATVIEKSINPLISATLPAPTHTSNNSQIAEIDTNEIDTRTSVQRPNPCITPIIYTIGAFDPKFNISKNYFIQTITDAASLWNKAAGKKLFEYDAQGNEGDLTINLMYDSRQQNTDENKLLGAEIQNTKDAATALEVDYEAMKVTFSKLKDEYTKKAEALNLRQKTYNDTVISWNEKGGAPRTEYDALTLEKAELQKENDSLVLDRETLTTMLADINTKITRHNEFVLFANEKVNINNSTAHKKFTEGNYNPGTNKISIYQFTDDIKLKRVLTHELGHALGLDHTKSKESIMYPVNSAMTTSLGAEDIQEIKAMCPQN